jgi:hypothetical protein
VFILATVANVIKPTDSPLAIPADRERSGCLELNYVDAFSPISGLPEIGII